jgi:hypothetical protein
VAVVVNDLAEVNIDFNLLRRKPVGESDGDLNLDDTVELENGYRPHPDAKCPFAPPATTLPNTATATRSVHIRVSALRDRLPLSTHNPLLPHEGPRPRPSNLLGSDPERSAPSTPTPLYSHGCFSLHSSTLLGCDLMDSDAPHCLAPPRTNSDATGPDHPRAFKLMRLTPQHVPHTSS